MSQGVSSELERALKHLTRCPAAPCNSSRGPWYLWGSRVLPALWKEKFSAEQAIALARGRVPVVPWWWVTQDRADGRKCQAMMMLKCERDWRRGWEHSWWAVVDEGSRGTSSAFACFQKKAVGYPCTLSTGLRQKIYFWKGGDGFLHAEGFISCIHMFFD